MTDLALPRNQKTRARAARSFDRHDTMNATMVATLFKCGCKPYEDIFTFNRWKAQGWFVRKGEKGVRLDVFAKVKEVDAAGVEREKKYPRATTVFCRCQVEKKGGRDGQAA